MTAYEDFMSRLNPSLAKKIKTASETEIVRLPLISKRLTTDLGGGIVQGRIALLFGSTSAAKTGMLLQSIGEWQKQGLVCAFIDVEGTYEKEWASRLGVNNDELILEQTTKSSGRVESACAPLLEAGVDVLVIDSISEIMPEVFINDAGELNSQDDRKQMGSQAKAIRQLVSGIHYLNTKTAVVLISQTTTNLGGMHAEQVPHGGQKVLFASTQVIRLMSSASPNQQIEENVMSGGRLVKKPVAREVDYVVRKNKAGPPYGKGTWRFYYDGVDVGVDAEHELLLLAQEWGVVEKAGAWLKYNGESIQGADKFIYRLKSEPDFKEELIEKVEEAQSDEVE